MLQNISLCFQWLPLAPGDSMQHARDMEDQLSNSALVGGIVDELRRLNPATDKRKAGERTENLICTLRSDIQRQHDHHPKATQRIVSNAAEHAKALLSNLRSLPADTREQFAFYLSAQADDSVSKWLGDLEAVWKILDVWSKHKIDGRRSAELHVAFAAIELIETLSPGIDRASLPLTDGSPFYLIAGYLWEAASGHQQSLKRYCDAILHAARLGRAEVSNTVIIGPPGPQ
jgi:hypothetical protein